MGARKIATANNDVRKVLVINERQDRSFLVLSFQHRLIFRFAKMVHCQKVTDSMSEHGRHTVIEFVDVCSISGARYIPRKWEETER